MRSRMDRRRCTLISGGRRLFGARPGGWSPFTGCRLSRRLRGSRRRADASPLGPGACDCYVGVDRSRGLGEHPLCGPVWSPEAGLFASAPCAERLPSRPSVAGYFSFSSLSHRLIEGYNLILASFEGGFGLIVGPNILQILQRLDQTFVLLYRQDDAHALA